MNADFQHVADLQAVRRPDHGGRSVFLDDRRAGPGETPGQTFAAIDRGLGIGPEFGEINRPAAGLDIRPGRLGAAEMGHIRLLPRRLGGDRERDQLDRAPGIGVAEASGIFRVEGGAQGTRVGGWPEGQAKGMLLALVAEIGEAPVDHLSGPEFPPERGARRLFHFGEDHPSFGNRRRVGIGQEGSGLVDPCPGQEHAEGRKITRPGRNDDKRNMQLSGELGRVQRSAAAEGEEREVP